MGPATKAEALKKLEGFNVKIGYPEKWRDYSGLQIVPGDLVGNAERAARFEWDYRRNRIDQPVDKAEWGMTPQTVNAYYNSVKNEIVFPAAILQPPFFDICAAISPGSRTREENFMAAWHSREQVYDIEGAFTADGELTALRGDLIVMSARTAATR